MEHIPGNPNTQQRELLAGKAYVELNKKVIEVTGADRLSWLNDMFSQKLDELDSGESTEALWLDVMGRILRDFHIVANESCVFLITFSEGIEQLLSQLQRLVFRAQVKLHLREDLRVFATFNSGVSSALASWQDSWPETSAGGWRYGKVAIEPWPYFESLMLDAPLDLTPASTQALTALRIAAWRPSGPDEIDEKAIPHEFDWLATAVHLNKGCYRGQETLAKVHNLGAPPRRLVFLHLDGSGHILPEPGDEVITDTAVGKITSVAGHYEMGPIALALVKRNLDVDSVNVRLADGTELAATVEDIVPQDAGGVVDLGEFRKKRI
jgi:folate-binding protein YgfZ